MQPLYKLIATSVGMALLASCGGGGGGNPNLSSGTAVAPDVSAGLIVLPPGDGALDRSSLLGRDINSNGVRDDIEIMVAKSVTHNGPAWQGVLQLARMYQGWLAQPTIDPLQAKARQLDEYRAIGCLRKTLGDPVQADPLASEVSWRTFSTKDRLQILRAQRLAAGPMIMPTLGDTC